MGVRVRDTNIETRMATVTTTANSLKMRPYTPPISSTGMKTATSETEIDRLSNILQTFNDRFGTQFENADKVRQMVESIAQDVAKNEELLNSIKYSDDQNARITNDKIAQQELLKHVTTNFDFYKLITDNEEAKEDFNAMLFGLVKEIFNKGLGKVA